MRDDQLASTPKDFGVGRHWLTKDDQRGTKGRSGSAAPNGLQGEECDRHEKNSADGREQAHGDVWNVWLEVVLPDFLKVEVAIETSEPAREGNKHLGQRRVNVHEEFSLYVLRSEATEAVAKTRG